MNDDNKKLFEELGKTIYERYTENTFSKLLKSEIDIIVLHTFLLLNLKESQIKNGSILYDFINKDDIYRLSLASGLTESMIQKKIESDFYNYRDKNNYEFDLKDFINNQIKNTKICSDEFIKDGKIRLIVSNPVMKKQVVNALVIQGSVPDFSFNRDIISIGIIDVLDILGKKDDSVNNTLKSAIENYINSKATEDEKTHIKNVKGNTPKEICKSLLLNVGQTVLSTCVEAATKAIFNIQ